MDDVRVTREAHGPLERLLLSAAVRGFPRRAESSVYRAGDLLVDAGFPRAAAALAGALADRPPRGILLTHYHEDHAGGVAALRRAFGPLPVWAAREQLAALAGSGPVPPYRSAYWGDPEPIADARELAPGTTVDAGGLALEVVATPGHTPGHLAFVARAGGEVLAVAGDLYTGERPLSAWYESAADDMAASCRRLAREGAALRLLPAHGAARADGAAVLSELAEWLDRQADLVREAAERLDTDDPTVVARVLYGAADPWERLTRGEFSRAAFARSVLAPVRALPAEPVR